MSAQSIEKRIENLERLDRSVLNDSVGAIAWEIYINPPEISKKYAGLMLAKTKKIGLEPHLIAKLFSLNYYEYNLIVSLDSIYYVAKKNDLTGIMAAALITKSNYYRKMEKYDSAMVAILEANNIYQKMPGVDGVVTTKQAIGDLYFAAGLYNEAKEVFEEINVLKGEIGQWENWRKRVIRNNLALIDMKNEDYDSAKRKFLISLKEVNKGTQQIVDSIAAVYIYCKLAEISLIIKDYRSAGFYFNISINNALKFRQNEFAANLFLTKGLVCYENGKPDSALYYSKIGESYLDKGFSSLSLNSKYYELLSKIYEKLNKPINAIAYKEKLISTKDSILKAQNKWEYLQILAKNNYEKLKMQLSFESNFNRILIYSIVSLTLVLIVIFILHVRLRRANLKLVDKTLEAEKSRIIKKKDIISKEKNSATTVEDEKLKDLINRMEELMQNEKIFLQTEITILKVAEQLNTNRSYLSNAINHILMTNFNGYVNKLRMQEIIVLMESGFFDNYTIDGISNYCGFKSRTAFIKVFTAYTGVSPSFFLKNIKLNKKKDVPKII
ncbi:MAG: AraC family transcriptional regulator [Ignavibacteriales bacterium]|nr:AraC family transcriptional regulator [Melioribacteraceae bacterium]MCF8307167.1 AraC family transcriptional regulator [Ignavibacteriales bacterium]MCF8316825.1 AraC family transcriptional regulator [Ignavibacteriales bacterium]MCF8438401.1 AraC family transcriptional regulator [Ignavibacteriales bacterium]